METKARWIGYGTSLALLVLVLWLLSSLRSELANSQRLIQVRFPETGALRPQDPVTRQGVTVGQVRSVAPDKLGALVTLELFDKRPLRSDARFVNFNHSLMGDRMVVLVPGQSPHDLIDGEVQQGLFANGVAETLHQIDGLLGMVLRLDSLSEVWSASGDRAGSWGGALQHRVYPAFDEIRRLGASLAKARGQITPRLEELEKTTSDLQGLASRVHGQTDTLIRVSYQTLQRIDSLSQAGSGLVSQVDSLLGLAVGPDAALRPMLLERTLYDRILQLTATLQLAMALLTSDGLEIIRGRNLRFFGAPPGDE